ncbi:hypothetical protein RLON56S_00094 [Alishewanella longhuensis]
MLNGYEIAMLLTIAASFVYMMWRLYHAIEQEKRDKPHGKSKDSDNDEC